MGKDTSYITRYTLSSLFEKSLKLLKPTWKNSLIAGAIVYVPVAAISAFFFQGYFSILIDIMKFSNADSPELGAFFLKTIPFFAFILVYSAIVGIAGSYATAVVSRNAFRCASGETPSWKELMGEVFNGKFGKLVVFLLLESLIITGAIVVFTLLITLGIVLASLGKLVALMVFIVIIAYIGLIFTAIAAQMIFQFGPAIIANEDVSGGAAIGKCFRLVKGQFWRVVGIGLLFSMALSFALSMVTMPLQFASIAPIYVKIIESAMSGAQADSTELLLEMSEAFKSMGFLMGLLFAVQYLVTNIIQPIFITLFYVDLRVRKGELADAAEFSDLSAPPQE